MRGRAYIYEPPAKVYSIDFTDSMPLERLQKLVGGWIEAVPYWNLYRPSDASADASCVAYCNENGKLGDFFVNNLATLDWDKAIRRIEGPDGKKLFPRGLIGPDGRASDYLVGNIVVVVGDREWMKDHVVGADDEDDYEGTEWWSYGDFIPMKSTTGS